MALGAIMAFSTLATIGLKAENNTSNSQLKYLENQGQWHNNVLYRSEVPGQYTFLEADGFKFLFYDVQQFEASTHQHCKDAKHTSCSQEAASPLVDCHAIKLSFQNANPLTAAALIVEDQLTERYNYFLGNDPAKWASNIHPVRSVIYPNIYEGVDLKAYSQGHNFKYDLIVQPNQANLNDIAIAYTGQSDICMIDGELFLTTSVTEAISLKPYTYQIINGETVEVPSQYVLDGTVLRYHFPQGFNENYELIIDPVLVGSTYAGTTGSVYGHSATYGQNDEIFGAGRSFDSQYPVTTGAFQTNFGGVADVCISKFSEDASALIYATYIGGGGTDLAANLITNSNNELILLCGTTSFDYPTSSDALDTTLGGDADMGITVLSEDGSSIIGSTYLGGSGDEGQGSFSLVTSSYYGSDGTGLRGELMIDDSDNVYVASYTTSNDFPVSTDALQTIYQGGYDGVIAKLNTNLSNIEWATFLGGSEDDLALGLRIDGNNDVYVVGGTASIDFPTTSTTIQPGYAGGLNDGYICKIGENGSSLMYSTFMGTSGDDSTYFIDLDAEGRVNVYGITDNGSEFPISSGVYENPGGFIMLAALDETLSTYEFSTILGGTPSETGLQFSPTAFTVDYCGNIYAGGFTSIVDMSTTPDAWAVTAPDGAIGGSGDFYFIVLDPNAEDINYGTYFGNSDWEHVDGGTCRYSKKGVVYQAVCTNSNSFPITAGAYAGDAASGWDLAVFKFDFEQALGVEAIAVPTPAIEGCVPLTVDFANNSLQAVSYEWLLDAGALSTDEEISYTFDEAGVYEVSLIAANPESCNGADTTTITIVAQGESLLQANFDYILPADCDELLVDFVTEYEIEGLTYTWDFGDENTSEEANPTHIYANSGTYEVSLTIDLPSSDCAEPSTIVNDFTIELGEGISLIDLGEDLVICDGDEVSLDATIPEEVSYLWSDGSENATLVVDAEGTYMVTAVNNCGEVTDEITVSLIPSISVDLGEDQIICDGNEIMLDAATDGATSYLWSDGSTEAQINPSTSGTYSVEVTGECGTVSDEVVVSLIPSISVDLGEDQIICDGNEIMLDAATDGATSYLWSDGSTEAQINLSTSGTYSVEVTSECGTVSDEVVVSLVPSISVDIGPDQLICEGELVSLNATTDGAVSYLWQNGSTESTFATTNAGTYSVEVSSECGTVTDQLVVQVINEVNVDLGGDQTLCLGETNLLDATDPNATSYLWSNGSTAPTLNITQAGIYSVQISNECSTDTDEVCVLLESCNDICTAMQVNHIVTCDEITETYIMYTSVAGGLPPYTYNGNVSTALMADNEVMTYGPFSFADTYQFTVVDANGCVKSVIGKPDCLTTPVELISYTGKALPKGNLLTWSVASEINNAYYRLEKSSDGINYKELTKIAGAGTTATSQQYQFIDENRSTGISYYRLHQVDVDGTSKDLGVVKIARDGTRNLSIQSLQPVPAHNQVYLSFTSNTAHAVQISIYDVTGRVVLQQSQQPELGNNEILLDISTIASGMYTVLLSNGTESVGEKLVKY